MSFSLLSIVLLVASAPAPEKMAVPVEDEPQHRTVFRNDHVQAFRVTLAPGQATLMHTHARDDAAVRLSTATVVANGPGQPPGPPESAYPGLVSARDNAAKPHTHLVHNIGTTAFDVVDVQILQRPAGAATPELSTPAAENASMRVYRYALGPGEAATQHAHTRPYLLVAATDVNLRMTAADGASADHADEAGDMHWVDVPATHVLMNRGTERAIVVEFEIK